MFRRRIFILSVFIFFLLASAGPVLCLAQQKVEEIQTDTAQAEEESEKIIASPQNIKEETGIFVFVGWMWLSIFVLIFFLRLKIREADRLFRLKFFSGEEE
jgi:hypothetical protein